MSSHSLFSEEALKAQYRNHYGSIIVRSPHIYNGLIVAIVPTLVVVLTWLGWSSYTKHIAGL